MINNLNTIVKRGFFGTRLFKNHIGAIEKYIHKHIKIIMNSHTFSYLHSISMENGIYVQSITIYTSSKMNFMNSLTLRYEYSKKQSMVPIL